MYTQTYSYTNLVCVQSETVKRLIYLLLVPAEIRHRSYQNRNFTESVMPAFGGNWKYAESVTIYSFGTETKIEIWSIFTAV